MADDETSVSRIDKVDPLEPSWFVPRSRIGEFLSENVVFRGAAALVYAKGTFIYRLSGRDRERSASFYTPEPLARLLVKHALMERCKDLPADELLKLKILEPAMGSAAFLVETTNQLSDLYLERKQRETGKVIPQEFIVTEKQKVRAFIADRNCFGVDLNPIAVELGAISLWLNCLHASDFSPWFGDQLHAGNSLIGARRATYSPNLMTAAKQSDLWLYSKPTEIGWTNGLPEMHIWQWLLPAKDMANFEKDKSITQFAREAQETIRTWRRSGFFNELDLHEIKLVQRLSRVAEALFDQVTLDLKLSRDAVNDEIVIWPDKLMPGNQRLDFHDKEHLNNRLTGLDGATNTLPFKRLKTAMDAWCALWIWPLSKANLLPTRLEFLQGMAMILEGGFTADGALAAPSVEEFADPTSDFFDLLEPNAPTGISLQEAAVKQGGLFRETNVEALVEGFNWLKVAVEVAENERFVHFDLIFADIMKSRGGFDVIVGNPPWVKPTWNEGLVLADIDPLYAGLSASNAKQVLNKALLSTPPIRRGSEIINATEAFLKDFVSTRGAMEVTSSEVMNPFAGGGSNNLYRCFIDLSFRLIAPKGYVALIHQDGHLGDPKSGTLRRHWYARIAKHFGYINAIKSKNFADAAHFLRFSQNIYRGHAANISFEQFTTAFLPQQIEDSYAHDGTGSVPDMKSADGHWDTRGHRDRIVQIDEDALGLIHALSEVEGVPIDEARLLPPYSAETLNVFRLMARLPKLNEAIPRITKTTRSTTGERSIDVPGYQLNGLWHETGAQKDGIIVRQTAFRPVDQIVLQGPHIHVSNPLYKTPRTNSRNKADYDVINLCAVPEDYQPRSNFGPAIEMDEYMKLLATCRWDSTKSHTDFYRVALRFRINLNSERSLITALIPPKVAHINALESISFENEIHTISFACMSSSIVYDFLLKISGITALCPADIVRFPWTPVSSTALSRTLRLNALTAEYTELWNKQATSLSVARWSVSDSRLKLEGPVEGPRKWCYSAGLRTEFARRLALVEIDVIIAQTMGLSLDQLLEIYRIYFPVLQEYEAGTWYDQNGRIVWTCSKGIPGVGWLDERGKSPSEIAWQNMLKGNHAKLTCTTMDDTLPGGPRKITRRFVGPFTRCDRIEDYKRAWAHFEQLESEGAV